MQNIYTKGQEWECLDTSGAGERLTRIIDSDKCDVIFTEYIADPEATGVWADYNHKYAHINANEWGNEIIPELVSYTKKYPLFSKGVYSALAVPEVLEACKEHDRVIVGGVVAECCVISTVWGLIDLGIPLVYLTDGVSGLDRPKEEACELTLSGLCPLHCQMMTVDEYLQELL